LETPGNDVVPQGVTGTGTDTPAEPENQFGDRTRMKRKLSEKVLYELKESHYLSDFSVERLLPCRSHREREQLAVFMDAFEALWSDDFSATFNRGEDYKTGKQATRARRFAIIEKIGQLVMRARGLQDQGTATKKETDRSR
jgi:hypothetical protein